MPFSGMVIPHFLIQKILTLEKAKKILLFARFIVSLQSNLITRTNHYV